MVFNMFVECCFRVSLASSQELYNLSVGLLGVIKYLPLNSEIGIQWIWEANQGCRVAWCDYGIRVKKK